MVTDEDEAADIDQEKASALLENNAAGAKGVASASAPSTSTPPMKRKDKKPKRVCKHAVYILVLFKMTATTLIMMMILTISTIWG